jgi:hypothetical protein
MIYSFSVATRVAQLRSTVYHDAYRSSAGDLVTPPLKPVGTMIGDVEVFFMLPKTSARGVLIFFHGCHHGGQDLFELPEDRIVALAALNRGLAVISPTSQNRDSGCWGRQDKEMFEHANVIGKWMASVGLSETLPRMGMGASSGGSFLFSVSKSLGLKSIASYVSGKGFPKSELTPSNVPATMYVHMPKDYKTANKIEENYRALLKASIPVEQIKVDSHPLTLELCSRRLPEFGDRRCAAFIANVLASSKSLLDKNDMSVLISYQNDGDWTELMEKAKLDDGLDSSTKKKKGAPFDKNFEGHSWLWASMAEEIAASSAVHEMTSEHRREVLDFLMKHAGIGPA